MTGVWLALSRALLRALLRAYPRRYREAVGHDMVEAFTDQCRHRLARGGVLALVALWCRTALGVAMSAVGERRDPVLPTKTDYRDEDGRWTMWMDGFGADLRYALRSLRRQWGFGVIAVALLTIGIGGTTGIYALASKLLLEPVPGIAHPQDLVAVGLRTPRSGFSTLPHPVVEQLDARIESFEGVAAASRLSLDLQSAGPPERVPGEIVSGNYFRVLGVGMTRGRGFTAEETASVGGPLVTVVSHRAWVERFGSDPGLIGGSVRLNGQPYTVVGVVDESFVGLRIDTTPPEFWVPLSTQPVSMPTEDWNPLTSMGDFWLSPFARLRDGVTLEQASAETSAFMASMLEAYPEQTEGMSLELTERIAVPNPSNRGELATILGILLGVVGLVLAVVCSNLANLFLSRTSVRRGEIAIRLALGSGRGRVLRQLLLESLVLSLSGGLLGLALAGSFAELVVRLYGRTLAVSMTPDLGIALFALLASVGSGLLFGLVPALRATRGDALPGLSDGGSRIAAGTVRLRRSFAVAQVALSVVLLVASALFVRSIRNLAGVDPGFDAQGALAVGFTLAPAHGELTEEEGWALYSRMVERLEGVPGVEAVAIALNTPFGGSERGGGFLVEDVEPPAGSNFDAPYNVVGPGYFRTMGIDVVRGREFTEEDRAGAPPVAVVSESFARRFWPEGDALGRRISRSGPDGPWIEIVGVVGDLRWRSLEDEPQASFYLPWFQRFESRGEIVVRAREARPALSGLIREEIRRLDPRLPALRVRALDSLVSSSVARYRLAASVTGAFSVLALLLAALGLYGLLSFGVSRRTREIGVRMAMGARERDVVASVTREGMMLTLVGLGLGGVAALAAVRTVRTLLYGVEGTDPVAYLSAARVLICVTALASWLPARRASRVDPAEALRSD